LLLFIPIEFNHFYIILIGNNFGVAYNKKDLLITCRVLKKYSFNSIKWERFVLVKILAINKPNAKVVGKVLAVGDEMEFALSYNIIAIVQ